MLTRLVSPVTDAECLVLETLMLFFGYGLYSKAKGHGYALKLICVYVIASSISVPGLI